MKHDDETLQAAIDAAMLEIGRQTIGNSFAASLDYETSWPAEQSDRLALAKAFLAKLPEAQPILDDDGRSLTELRAENRKLEKELAHQIDMGCQAAVCGPKVALDEAIRRMEAVPVEELMSSLYEIETSRDEAEQIRSRLIAAARGEAEQTEETKPASPTFEAHGKTWNCHTKGDPIPVDTVTRIDVLMDDDAVCLDQYVEFASTWNSVIGWRYANKPDSTDWKAKYEKAEAELAAIKSSSIGVFRLLSETMRCVTAVSKIEDLVTTDHETKDAFIARVRGILGH